MYKTKVLLFAIGVTFAASAASASNVSWDCSVKLTGNTGLITDRYLFNYDADNAQANVVDGLINYHKKGFMPVGKIKDDGNKVVFSWQIRDRTTSQTATLSYDVSIDRTSKLFKVHVVPLGYDNFQNARGACKEVPGPIALK